jgi:flagellar L-ring protein precursor FlgH
MSRRTSDAIALAALVALSACASPYGRPIAAQFEPTYAQPAPPPPQVTGSIYSQARYSSLIEDNRARRIGDVLTVQLVESTQASKQASQQTSRTSNFGLDLPDAKPFSSLPDGLFQGGSNSSFKGSGSAAQGNSLSGQITVTVAQVYPNGTMLVRGQKLLQLNRGEEYVQISGIVRKEDISPDNRIASTRVADARITYAGTGEIAAQSRQGWLQRFFTAIAPF